MAEQFNQAQFFVDMFGGQAELARAIDVPKQSVGYWCRETKHIPYKYHQSVLDAAREAGHSAHPVDFIRHLIAG